jgi:hypothetical protein
MDKAKTIAAETKAQRADEKGNTIKGKTKEQLAKEVKGLLNELRATTDGDEKKAIRRKLRARGHFGGLGERSVKTKKKVVKDKRARKAQNATPTPATPPAHAEAA